MSLNQTLDNGFKVFSVGKLAQDEGDDGIRFHVLERMTGREMHCPLTVNEAEAIIAMLQNQIETVKANW